MTQTEYEQNIIKKASARSQGTYDIYIEIDIDCTDLVDACGLEYKECEDDMSQNEICLSLNKDEFTEVVELVSQSWTLDGRLPDEQDIGTILLNPELGEYTTKVTVYTPSGDIISFS